MTGNTRIYYNNKERLIGLLAALLYVAIYVAGGSIGLNYFSSGGIVSPLYPFLIVLTPLVYYLVANLLFLRRAAGDERQEAFVATVVVVALVLAGMVILVLSRWLTIIYHNDWLQWAGVGLIVLLIFAAILSYGRIRSSIRV